MPSETGVEGLTPEYYFPFPYTFVHADVDHRIPDNGDFCKLYWKHGHVQGDILKQRQVYLSLYILVCESGGFQFYYYSPYLGLELLG